MTTHLPIGGGQVAAVMGLDPHKSALEVWFELTRRPKHGEGAEPPEERKRKRALERHRALESVCITYGTEELEQITGHVCTPESPGLVVHPEHAWAVSAPPCAWSVAGQELVLGVPKTVSGAEIFHKRWGQEQTDQVADAVLAADQWHMLLRPDVRRCMNPVLIGGWKFNFSWWMVERDDELGAMLLERAGAWYEQYVVKGQPPPAVPRDDALLSRLWSGRKDQQIRPEMELVEIAVEAKRLSIEGDRLKHQADKLRTRLRERMGDATAMRWGENRKVTLSVASPKKVVHWQGVATELGSRIAPEEFTALIAKNTYEKLDKRTMKITIPGFDDEDDDG